MANGEHPLECDFSWKRADGREKKVAHVNIDRKIDRLVDYISVYKVCHGSKTLK